MITVETAIHDNQYKGIGNLGVQRAWSELIMNVLANPKGKCWALECEFLEA